jgi:hypothetical protein
VAACSWDDRPRSRCASTTRGRDHGRRRRRRRRQRPNRRRTARALRPRRGPRRSTHTRQRRRGHLAQGSRADASGSQEPAPSSTDKPYRPDQSSRGQSASGWTHRRCVPPPAAWVDPARARPRPRASNVSHRALRCWRRSLTARARSNCVSKCRRRWPLSPGTQDAVRLRVVEELSYPDRSRRLGIREGAARVPVSRGLAAVAGALDAGNLA